MAYKKHKTFFGKLFGWIGDFMYYAFKNANHDLLQAAITVTEWVKSGLASGVLDKLTSFTTTGLDDNLLKLLREKIPLVLADELALQSINESTSQTDAEEIMTKIVDSFGGLSDKAKEKFYTSVAASVYTLLLQVKEGKKITFGQAAALVETAYQAYIQSKEDQP